MIQHKDMHTHCTPDAHGHCHCHGHTHSHGHGAGHAKAFMRIGVSLLMLVAGMAATSLVHLDIGAGWRLAWYILAFLPVGIPVMAEGWKTVRGGDVFNEFTLMTIACVGAFCIGEYPEAVGVMLFYSLGETLQDLAVGKATRDISRLVGDSVRMALVWRGDRLEKVRPENVAVGDEIEVRPGGMVPLDGILLGGDAVFDTSALTGESVPRAVGAGGQVLAGMVSAGSVARLRVNRAYSDSALSRIMSMVRDASSRKAKAEQFIRKFARVYTPVVTLLAALLVAVPALVAMVHPAYHYVFSDWLYRGLVFLVVSCPCALVISVPLSYFAGIGAASRRGILFKGGNYLEAIAHVDTVAFDKTGTLTEGRFHVTAVHSSGIDGDMLLKLLASAGQSSSHPVAAAVADAAASKGLPLTPAEHVTEHPGKGTEAEVGGRKVLSGNLGFLRSKGVECPEVPAGDGNTIVACAVDGVYRGYVEMADTLKPDAREAVSRLRRLGIRDVLLLSGDRKEAAERVGESLGMTASYGALLPDGKARIVEGLRKDGRKVAFVGDGFNDAPVLALSDVGIAMGGLGSEAAVESADVVVETDVPSKVAEAVVIARFTRRIVRENIVGAIAVKAVILVLGALGDVGLWAAVFADVGVALLAVANSMRILWRRYR